MNTLGLIATLHSGLTDLKRHGQERRLLDYYFKTYLTKFDRLHYFSYFAENISEFTDDAELLAKVTVYGKPAWLPDALYSFFMPLVHWRAFRSCGALRVFQATGAFPLIFSSIAGGAPALVTFGYDYSEFARLRNKGIFVRWMIGMAERMALGFGKKILVPNRLPERYESKVSADKIVSVPNGADTAVFCPNGERNNAGPERKILFIGRFEKQKNLDCLLRAAAKIQRNKPVRLILIGEGSEKAFLEKLAVELKLTVDFLLPVPHEKLVEFYRAADVFALPSWTEGHPKVLLEAMSCGAACVVSRCRAHETVIGDGAEGLFFDPASVDDCAAALERVLSEEGLADSLGVKAREKVLQVYDLKRNVLRETDILWELAHA